MAVTQLLTIDRISLNDQAEIIQGSSDPSSGAGVSASTGSLYMRTSGSIYCKTGGSDTAWSVIPLTLNDLGQTSISSPSSGEIIKYDGSDWVNSNIGIDNLSDVDVSTSAPTTGNTLTWDGSNFTPAAVVTGTETEYSNSSSTTVNWNNGLIQLLSSRSGTVALTFSNPTPSKMHMMEVVASGGNMTFVFPAGHYTDSGASSITVTNGKRRILKAWYFNSVYYWFIGPELEAIITVQTPTWGTPAGAGNESIDGNNDITKTSGGSDWNSNVPATETFSSGDVWVNTVVDETNTARAIGLSDTGAINGSLAGVDFTALISRNGTLYAYLSGNSKATIGAYSNGDDIKVAVESGSVVIRQNDTLKHTFVTSPSGYYDLRIMTAFGDNNATIKSVTYGTS